MREQVTSGHAGAVALNVLEFGRVSAFRDRLIVVGAAEPGDFALPYQHVDVGRGVGLSMSWPFWHRASDRYADAVADTILQHGSRLVEVHNRGRLFLQLARRLGPQTRMCLYLHNDPRTMEALETPIERVQLLERASIVYCLSDYIRNRLIDGVEGLSERVVVLPNGTVPLPADRPTREGTILFVGRLIPEKGVEELFDALRHIAALLPDWRVVIIGRAPERHRSRYERTLEELRAIWGERLVLKEFGAARGGHAGLRARSYHRRTFALAGAVRPDGTRSPGAGSAVIASRSGGLPEIVGPAGFLLDAVTPDAIEHAILTLARDPARREALGKAGERRARMHFDIALLSSRLDAWRDNLLAT